MSAYTELLDAILTVVRGAGVGVTMGLREEQARRMNWSQLLSSGELPLPFVIVSCARLTGTGKVPSGNGFSVPITLHLVTAMGESGDATQGTIESLITIWQALLVADLPLQDENGVVIDGSAGGQVLSSILNVSTPLSAGALTCQFNIDLTP